MNRIKSYIILSVCTLFAFTGCDYLDYDESNGRTKEGAFSYMGNVKGLATNVYSYLPSDLGSINGAMMESATDNSVYTWENNAITKLNNGTWSAKNTIDDAWNLWAGIRSANLFLDNFDLEVFKRFEYNEDYERDIKIIEKLPYEVRFLRAFYFFELAKRYGNIPLLTRTYTEDEINSVSPVPFDDVIDFVAEECRQVAPELPIEHATLTAETGRATRGAALALRSRALLYAASKLHNPEGNLTKWEAAAKAAHDVIALNVYELPKVGVDPLYKGDNDMLQSKQLIFERRERDKTNSFEAQNEPMGYVGAKGGNTPTQNLVDAYEMSNGEPFDWSNSTHVANMYYDSDANPTRDPRLYLNVLTNGSEWLGQTVETFEEGKHKIQSGSTLTGYYLRKYMNPSVSLDPNKSNKLYHHYILFRYAEILLNYAEAMYEWQGADVKPEGYSLTAREALNLVRSSANMRIVQAEGEEFKEKLRNERRIELAFEGHRFFDLRRWQIAGGEEVRNIYGVEINKNGDSFTYKKVLVETRKWEDRMNLYPFPQDEIYMCPNLVQNPGW